MTFQKLNAENIGLYIEYLRQALKEEPDMMWIDAVDEAALRERICDPLYQNTPSILAIDDGRVVGRIEYHFYGCLQDGYRMAYVDWLYVLKGYRHRGIAQRLFDEFELECLEHRIDQYFLIRAENPEADSFYSAREHAELTRTPTLRKTLS